MLRMSVHVSTDRIIYVFLSFFLNFCHSLFVFTPIPTHASTHLSQVGQWISEICEKSTKRMVALGRPFKYIVTAIIVRPPAPPTHDIDMNMVVPRVPMLLARTPSRASRRCRRFHARHAVVCLLREWA
jgi:hypothetical protein